MPQSNDEKLNTYDRSVLNNKSCQIYDSPLLDRTLNPTPESLKLNPELEPLATLILSQYEVFAQPIQGFGHINLTLTKIIKKIATYSSKTIIRFLEACACELTTSPAFADNPSFLQLKEEMQHEVSNFIEG